MKSMTVKEAGRLISSNFKKEYRYKGIIIRGTISNLRTHFSGISFFSLMEEDVRLLCFIGKMRHNFLIRNLSDGVDATITGDLIYDANRSYALLIVSGVSGIRESESALRKKRMFETFAEKGYFDASAKKLLPLFPFHIGVVSSSSGAVIHDIMKTGKNRNPAVRYTLFNSSVQGKSAAASIMTMIEKANSCSDRPDLLILARGGGSEEDLSVFDDPLVVEAVHRSEIPIISAIGHETDTTICDYAADVRASTPTQAAEIAIPDTINLRRDICGQLTFCQKEASKWLEQRRKDVIQLVEVSMPAHAKAYFQKQAQRMHSMAKPIHFTSSELLRKRYSDISTVLLQLDLGMLKQMERLDESGK